VALNPNCPFWNDWASWNDTVKQGLQNFALASMDALMYPFFWTWKVSHVLRYYLGGTPESIVSLSWFRFTSTFTSTPKRAPVSSVFSLCHMLRPENSSYLYSTPSSCHLNLFFFIATALFAPHVRVRCRVHTQMTAFHASPCNFPDYYSSIVDWNVPLPIDSRSCKRRGF